MKNSHPNKKAIKPLNLYEAELEPEVDVTHFGTPRIVVMYAHLTKTEAEKIVAFLQENLNHPATKGTIILPLIGRAV